ncbi:MAG: Gfo/Idh/MocA family oxidoreductase [Gemmataceae bacterium]|nr:Gfo/Idh/MocA family oxidoreductase [Gemmataceae bacterium]
MKSITRRKFVAASAVLASGPLITTGLFARQSPSERLRLGFIGVGKMNSGHLGHFLGQKDTQVVAVCDVDTKRRVHAQKTVESRYADAKKSGAFKGCAAYIDFRELIARKDIDAVVIATPDHWHTIPAIEAIKAGKDVYCEKPLTLTIGEAKLLIDAVRKYDRVFQVGSQQRSESNFRLACELVRSGKIGKLEAVYANVAGPSKPCDLPEEPMEEGLDWDRWLGPAPKRPYNSVLAPRGVHNHFPNWRNYREYSGGMMTDWGAHHFDIAQWGLGADESGPVEIIPPSDPSTGTGLKFIYANGVPLIHATEYAPGKAVDGIVFVGAKGRIQVNRGKISADPESILKTPTEEISVKLYKSAGHQRDWLDCIKSRKRPICDVEVGARSVTVCHLGNIGYWTGQKFKWDPKAWKFVDASKEVEGWYDRERRGEWQLPTL